MSWPIPRHRGHNEKGIGREGEKNVKLLRCYAKHFSRINFKKLLFNFGNSMLLLAKQVVGHHKTNTGGGQGRVRTFT